MESNIKNAAVTITDTIYPDVEYTGSVKILYIDKHGGKTIVINQHNAGDAGLFTCVTRALSGTNFEEYTPSYIMGYFANKAAFTQNIGFAANPQLFLNEQMSDGTNANIVQYTFMIPVNNLVQRSAPIDTIKLFNKKGQICAVLDLDKLNRSIATNISSNILVYWKLKFAPSIITD